METPTKREDTGFIWDSVLEYRKLVSDSTMVVSLAEYVNTHNEFDDSLYVPLLAYLYKHHNEGYDEGILHSLYRIIKKEPNIGERIVSYIESFPQDQLSTMREDFFTSLYFEFSEYNEEHQLETSNSDFLELFPFFNNEQYLIYLAPLSGEKCQTTASSITLNNEGKDSISVLIRNCLLNPNDIELEESTAEVVFLLLSENPKEFVASLEQCSPEVVNKVISFIESPLTDETTKEEIGRILSVLKEEDGDSLLINKLIHALRIAQEKY